MTPFYLDKRETLEEYICVWKLLHGTDGPCGISSLFCKTTVSPGKEASLSFGEGRTVADNILTKARESEKAIWTYWIGVVKF